MALSGYIYTTTYIKQKYRAPKFHGHHLLYRSLFVGLQFFVVSTILFIVFWPLTSQSSVLFDNVAKAFPELTQVEFNLYSILFMSLALSLTIALILNWISFKSYFSRYETEIKKRLKSAKTRQERKQNKKKIKELRRQSDYNYDLETYTKQTDNAYISHVIEAFQTPHFLLLSLENRRCYVCYPYETTTPNNHQESQELAFIPIMSGYRDDHDLCLELTTVYEDVKDILSKKKSEIDKSPEARKKDLEVISSFKITVPYNRIISISSFDHTKYHHFKLHENIRRSEIRTARKPDEA